MNTDSESQVMIRRVLQQHRTQERALGKRGAAECRVGRHHATRVLLGCNSITKFRYLFN